MKSKKIKIPQNKLRDFCKKYHIRKLALFGSVLRSDFKPTSDIDVLVEFEPGKEPGFIRLGEIESELSELLGGRRIDLVTERALNPHLREKILKEARVQYAEK